MKANIPMRIATEIKPVNSLSDLQIGNIITNKVSGNAYLIISENSNGTFEAIRTINVSNPSEWEVLIIHT